MFLQNNFGLAVATDTLKSPAKAKAPAEGKAVPTNSLLHPLAFFRALTEHKDRISIEDLSSNNVHDDAFKPHTKPRAFLDVFRLVRRLIRKNSAAFSGPYQPQYSHQYFDVEAEDIHRALLLCRMIDRKVSNDGQHRATDIPIYFPPGSDLRNTDDQNERNKRSLAAALGRRKGLGAWMDVFSNRDAPDTEENVDKLDAIFARRSGLRAVHLDTTIGVLSDDQALDVCEKMGADVEVLFGPDDKIIDLTGWAKAPSDSFRRSETGVAAQLGEADFLESGLGETADARAERTFRAMISEMNQVAHTPPPWETIVRELGLTVTDLQEPSTLTGELFEITCHGLKMMPWQPHAVCQLVSMLESETRAAILADDVGLGKTVTTLTTVIVRHQRLRRARKAWRKGTSPTNSISARECPCPHSRTRS